MAPITIVAKNPNQSPAFEKANGIANMPGKLQLLGIYNLAYSIMIFIVNWNVKR
jgi:hypothetical protein